MNNARAGCMRAKSTIKSRNNPMLLQYYTMNFDKLQAPFQRKNEKMQNFYNSTLTEGEKTVIIKEKLKKWRKIWM